MTAPTSETPDPDDEAPSTEFARALEDFERGETTHTAQQTELQPGAKVHGTVIAIAGDHLLLDVGGRSEASAELAPFRR